MQERILEISKKKGLSHIGSSLGVGQLLEEIDKVKRPEDIIVLDEAHGALGYYVYLEEKGIADAEELFKKHGVHQNKDSENEIHVSGGSLGLAGSIALGLAIGSPDRNIYCITSDGALAEGIWWETLRLKADLSVDNLKIYVNANGWSGYDPVNVDKLEERVHFFCPDVVFIRTNIDDDILIEYPQLEGLGGHYKTI